MNEKCMRAASLFIADFVQTLICLTAQQSMAKKTYFPSFFGKCILVLPDSPPTDLLPQKVLAIEKTRSHCGAELV